MDALFILLGQNGVLAIFGLTIFLLIYKHSVGLFNWIEDKTYQTKNFAIEKLEFLHINIEEKNIIFILLGLSLGIPSLIFGIVTLLGSFILGVFLGGIFFIIGLKLPKVVLDFLVEKRITAYQGQMVDGLNLLANGIRAGLTVNQALAMVVDELPPPISEEFNILLQQNKIGSPLEECFENLAKRIPTEDNDMFVTSVNILKETGGNLAETFDTIVSVIRERVRLQQKIATYTAQGMMQGGTIFCMPFIMGFLYYLSDPTTMERMFTNPIGIVALILTLALNLTGGYLILKIVKIKV